MKCGFGLCLALVFCGVLYLAFGTDGSFPPVAAAAPPPLVVDKDDPLLLEEPKKKEEEAFDPWATPKGPVADNKACFVCHANYEEEPLAKVHAEANIGCMKCHGESLDHRDDEDNITPPETMYPADKIDSSCEKCHEEHDVSATKVIERWQKKCPQKTDPTKIVCTDCHGQHRLKIRTVRWNKETGELIVGEQKASK